MGEEITEDLDTWYDPKTGKRKPYRELQFERSNNINYPVSQVPLHSNLSK